MEGGRVHPEGVRRSELAWVLTQPHLVETAVRIDRCLLCRDQRVNEAGLCDICFSHLDPEEQALADAWCAGAMP